MVWTSQPSTPGVCSTLPTPRSVPCAGRPSSTRPCTWGTSGSTIVRAATSRGPSPPTARAGCGSRAVRIGLPGLYNVYNALAAATVAGESGVGLPEISRGLGEFGGAFGRVERVMAGDREAFLLLIKNPVGFNEILRTFVTGAEATNVLIAINDNDADGRDVSWLWDVDFEMLADARTEGNTDAAPFTVSGIRAHDMAVRLKYAELPVGPVIPDREEAIKSALAATPPGETLYVLPTYTAMLEIRKTLSELGYTHPFWAE
jgi:UDP-N-acetylmuramyl tripeptide synthase